MAGVAILLRNKHPLEIPEKRVTATIGLSGCGKSTFLRCVTGKFG